MPDWNNASSSQDSAMFYSFDLGPIHFISLNTEYYYFLNYGGHSVMRQFNWLIRDLEVRYSERNYLLVSTFPLESQFGRKPQEEALDCYFWA